MDTTLCALGSRPQGLLGHTAARSVGVDLITGLQAERPAGQTVDGTRLRTRTLGSKPKGLRGRQLSGGSRDACSAGAQAARPVGSRAADFEGGRGSRGPIADVLMGRHAGQRGTFSHP